MRPHASNFIGFSYTIVGLPKERLNTADRNKLLKQGVIAPKDL
jgi:hypothetical protein